VTPLVACLLLSALSSHWPCGRAGTTKRHRPPHRHRADAQRGQPQLHRLLALRPHRRRYRVIFVIFSIAVAAAEAAVDWRWSSPSIGTTGPSTWTG